MATEQNISSSKLKHAVLTFFFLILLLPMIQQHFPFIKERKLEGVDNVVETPPIFLADWFEGKYQKELEPALDINIGFRKTLVRTYNQLNYSLLNVSKAQDVIVGKNNYIYVASYIAAYNGADFRGKTFIDLQIEKALVLQHELKKKNIDLVFAFAPGKGSFYPEYIPDVYLKNVNPDSTNYAYYTKTMREKGLNVLDIRKYFLAMKDTVSHRLFPVPGVHWTEYASVMAADTISGYISQLRNVKLTPSHIKKYAEKPEVIKWGDYDAANLMNVFSVIPHTEQPYIEIAYTKDSSCVRPSLLTIADSYYSVIEATHIPDSLYSKSTYWLYERRPSSDKSKEFDFRREVEERDVIMVLGADATLGQFPYFFIDQAYEVYAPKNKAYYELKNKEFRFFISDVMNNIHKNKKWKRELIKNAKDKKGSEIDEYINVAVWLYNEQQIRNKIFVPK